MSKNLFVLVLLFAFFVGACAPSSGMMVTGTQLSVIEFPDEPGVMVLVTGTNEADEPYKEGFKIRCESDGISPSTIILDLLVAKGTTWFPAASAEGECNKSGGLKALGDALFLASLKMTAGAQGYDYSMILRKAKEALSQLP